MIKRECNIKYVNVWKLWRFDIYVNQAENAYLKLRSGDAQRIAMLGIGGTRRIAIITWFFQRRDNESRWLSDGVFFGGAELLNNDARLSLTGLFKWNGKKRKIYQNICNWFEIDEIFKLTLDRWHWIKLWLGDSILAMPVQQQPDIAAEHVLARWIQIGRLPMDHRPKLITFDSNLMY